VDFLAAQDSEERFEAYVDALAGFIGHADRRGPLKAYCEGLLLPGERKSVEPMAAVTAPARVAAQHQSLLHFVGQAPWSDEAVLAKVRALVLPAVERHGPVEAWIIDDTGFPKKGEHSVGVMRQYCGQLGKRENCQVAVSLSVANHGASLPVAYRLYLPEEWAADAECRKKAHVPASITFRTKPEIALQQIKDALTAGIPRGVVLMDAAYGGDTDLRTSIAALGLSYCRRHSAQRHGLATGDGAAAAQALVGARTPADAAASGCRAPTGRGQGAGYQPGRRRLAHHHLARRHRRPPHLAIRSPASPRRPPRLSTVGMPAGRMAAGRMARRRSRTDQILVLKSSRGYHIRTLGRPDQTALADRA